MHKIFSSLSIIALSGAMFAADVNVQTLSAGDDLAAAVAAAKAAYQETKNAQEIVLGDGVYKTTAELMLDFPVAIRGGSGDPAKVTVEAQAVKNAQIYRVFTLNHSEARVESVTVTGGRLTRYGNSNFYNYGAGIRIAAPFSDTQSDHSKIGNGGTVTNCVITGNHAPDRYCAAAAVILWSSQAVVTHCVITNNTCTRQLDGWYPKRGATVQVCSGLMSNCLIAHNSVTAPDLNPSGAPADKSAIVGLEGGALENCAVYRNSIGVSYDPAIIYATNSAKVVNTLMAENAIDAGTKLKADWEAHNLYWGGAAGCFSHCAMTTCELPSDTCVAFTKDDVFDLENGDLRVMPDSVLRGAGSLSLKSIPQSDLLGRPRRTAEDKIDIGPYAYDPQAPAPFKQKLWYVKAGNLNAAAPYASEETAAADIQSAIDAAEEGRTVVICEGIYEIVKNVVLKKRLHVRGKNGRAGDVIIRNVYSGSFNTPDNTGRGRCLLIDADPGATVSGVTLEDASVGGSYTLAGALYIGKDVTGEGARANWFKAGKGGCVSNVIIRNCKNTNKFGHGTALTAVGANALVTHCTITNNTSSCGYVNGATQSAFVELEGGAKMENSLVAFNRVSLGSANEPQGRLQSAVSLRGASKLRFCTVVSNSCSMVGGVNIVRDAGARVEYCVIARNTAYESVGHYAAPEVRHHDWGFFNFSRDNDALGGSVTLGQGVVAEKIADEIDYVANNADIVNAVFTGCIGEHFAPGFSGAKATLEEVYSGVASGRWRLKSDSPARDKASEDSAGTMPLVDLLGNARLVNGEYDAGCFEGAIPAGLRIFCK